MFKFFSKRPSKATVIQELKETLVFQDLKYRALIREKDELIQEQERTIVSLQEKLNAKDNINESLTPEQSLTKDVSESRTIQEQQRSDNMNLLQDLKLKSDQITSLTIEVDRLRRELEDRNEESEGRDRSTEENDGATKNTLGTQTKTDEGKNRTKRLGEKLRAQSNKKQELKKELAQTNEIIRSLVETIKKTKRSIQTLMRNAAHAEDRKMLKDVYKNLSDSFKVMVDELRTSKEKKEDEQSRHRNDKTKTKKLSYKEAEDRFRAEQENLEQLEHEVVFKTETLVYFAKVLKDTKGYLNYIATSSSHVEDREKVKLIQKSLSDSLKATKVDLKP
ncbi:hypothetical protein WMY93_004437 [Mugilogobius chulae]|uniref:Uncharacterized protein n=1 Tax=Mugilogobius chulae TaxID=88201 RepID=A0AAW0PS18_9GOBI